MLSKSSALRVLGLSLVLLSSTSVYAANDSSKSLESRISRMERLLDSQGLVDMLVRLETIQTELQSMRGEIEVLTHSFNNIKKRQRDLYLDIDRRLLNLERKGKTSSTDNTTTTSVGGGSALISSSTTNKTAVSTSTTPVLQSADEIKAYQQAFDLLRELRYDKSIEAFIQFIITYPKGRYAHIAQYWIGEANYAQHKYKKAIKAYRLLVTNYTRSPKIADAMLKIGYSYFELKQIDKAKSNLETLIRVFPGTTEASQAQNKLQKIKINSTK